MTHQNLVLTEEAIKSHSKRLQKELKNLNQDLPLTQVQTLLAKSFGFKNFHELKQILINENKRLNQNIEDISQYLITISENQKQINDIFLKECREGNYSAVKLLLENKQLINNADKNVKDFHGNDNGAIYQACSSDNLKLVQYLIEDKGIIYSKETPWIFYYCQKKEIFEYIYNHFLNNNKNIKIQKQIIAAFGMYTCEVQKHIIHSFKFNQKDYNQILYNAILSFTYYNHENMQDRYNIISLLISLKAELYSEETNIFNRLMSSLTYHEKIKNGSLVNHRINLIKHLNNKYGFLQHEKIKDIINYLKKNPKVLSDNKHQHLNNSYMLELINN